MIFQITEDDFAVWDFLHSEENQLHIEKNHQKCMIFICFLQTYIINAMTFRGRKHIRLGPTCLSRCHRFYTFFLTYYIQVPVLVSDVRFSCDRS